MGRFEVIASTVAGRDAPPLAPSINPMARLHTLNSGNIMNPPTWTSKITAYLRDRVIPVTVSRIAEEALSIPYEDRGAYDLTFVTTMLRRLKWRRVRSSYVERWHPPEVTT